MEELKDELASINIPELSWLGNSVILVHYKISKMDIFEVL